MNTKRVRQGLVLYPIFIVVAALVLFPVLWMVYSSFKSNSEIFGDVFSLPSSLYFGNYIQIFTVAGMADWFRNSVFVSVVSVLGILALSSMAAYAFASMRFRGKTALFMLFLLGLMVPPQALIISGYTWISILQLIDSHWALIFTYFGWTSLGVLVLRDAFNSVPREVKEAARVDGAGHGRMFFSIMLPLARPTIATLAIFYFMWVWNDFIYPLVYMQSESNYTIPLGVMFMSGRFTVEWGLQMAGLTVATTVPVLVYLFFQRQFTRGILSGALKG